MILASLLLLHGGDAKMDLVYFWSALLIVALPLAAFITLGVLVTRGYYRRRVADGGGEPPPARLPAD